MLIAVASAIQLKSGAEPDVFGVNGLNYLNNDASLDLSEIGIDIHEDGAGEKCEQHEWATVQWKAYTPDGVKVVDSSELGDGRPRTFAIGLSEAFKCWDLVLPLLNVGTKASLKCPSSFVRGGEYSTAKFGGDEMPYDVDINFELEVLNCEVPVPTYPKTLNSAPDKHWKVNRNPYHEGNCFYLKNKESEHESTPLVLDCDGDGCDLDEWVTDEKSQMLFWDKDERE